MQPIENYWTRTLQRFRIAYTRFSTKNIRFGNGSPFDYLKGEDVSNAIKKELEADKPSLICRFGSTELLCMLNYLSIKHHRYNLIDYVKWQIAPFWFEDHTEHVMWNCSGIFPSTFDMLEKFTLSMLEDIQDIDILATWRREEIFFRKTLEKACKVNLDDLNPFLHTNPWSEILEGKKVLVIHPFKKSIEQQYLKRELLFKDKRVLPEFELEVIPAIQSIGKIKPEGFNDWFEALDFMKNQISNTTFDIAIIGCGAYGLPLAAHVKRMGKKAIHLAGATQLLFGIMGKRWEDQKLINDFVNEHWIRPLPEETPETHKNVEGGCYW